MIDALKWVKESVSSGLGILLHRVGWSILDCKSHEPHNLHTERLELRWDIM